MPSPKINRFSHEAMTTPFEVIVAHEDGTLAQQAANSVFAEIDRLDGLLSRHNPCSDIAQVNRLAPGASVRIAPDAFECLAMAAWACRETDGAFDVTVTPLLTLQESPEARRTPQEIDRARKRVGMDRIGLDDADFSVCRHDDSNEGVEIDLGGIGKGFALDKAANILEDWDIYDCLLVAGGSTVLALGNGPDGNGWVVGVGANWGKAAGIDSTRLHDEALSGSGTEVKGAHIVDPASGLPAVEHLAAWAIAPSATVADALSTAFLVMPTEEVQALCAKQAVIRAYVVEPDGCLEPIPRP